MPREAAAAAGGGGHSGRARSMLAQLLAPSPVKPGSAMRSPQKIGRGGVLTGGHNSGGDSVEAALLSVENSLWLVQRCANPQHTFCPSPALHSLTPIPSAHSVDALRVVVTTPPSTTR
jgi:hypothetical protein